MAPTVAAVALRMLDKSEVCDEHSLCSTYPMRLRSSAFCTVFIYRQPPTLVDSLTLRLVSHSLTDYFERLSSELGPDFSVLPDPVLPRFGNMQPVALVSKLSSHFCRPVYAIP